MDKQKQSGSALTDTRSSIYCIQDYSMPLPPYGRELAQVLSSNKRPKNDIYLFLGKDAWLKAKDFQKSQFVLVLPEGDQPISYKWPVHHCFILCFETSTQPIQVLKQLVQVLLEAGAVKVRLIRYSLEIEIYGGENE
jgi:hypothetical protein